MAEGRNLIDHDSYYVVSRWQPPAGVAEDRNDRIQAEARKGGGWQPPAGVAEDRNVLPDGSMHVIMWWQSPFGVAEDRNGLGWVGGHARMLVAVTLWGV